MRPRLILLCLITLALLAAAGWTGVLSLIWQADRVHSAPIFGSVTVLGLCFLWMRNWKWAERIGLLLPLFGLALTSYGIITIATGSGAGGDYYAIRTATILSLTPNCIAGFCLLWLTVVRWICEL